MGRGVGIHFCTSPALEGVDHHAAQRRRPFSTGLRAPFRCLPGNAATRYPRRGGASAPVSWPGRTIDARCRRRARTAPVPALANWSTNGRVDDRTDRSDAAAGQRRSGRAAPCHHTAAQMAPCRHLRSSDVRAASCHHGGVLCRDADGFPMDARADRAFIHRFFLAVRDTRRADIDADPRETGALDASWDASADRRDVGSGCAHRGRIRSGYGSWRPACRPALSCS